MGDLTIESIPQSVKDNPSASCGFTMPPTESENLAAEAGSICRILVSFEVCLQEKKDKAKRTGKKLLCISDIYESAIT
jgi:hypothetical protein